MTTPDRNIAAEQTFRVGHQYIDRGNPHKAGDEFSGWLLDGGRTIGMTGGIRPRSFVHLNQLRVPAYVVLVTTHISADYSNPWDDVIDERAGVVHYWGDAKFSDRHRLCEQFAGNRCLCRVYDEILTGERAHVPPILHFQRPKSGRLIFTGLCSLEIAQLTWFEDGGKPIRNYRYQLAILDEEFVDTQWLKLRMNARSIAELNDAGPAVWKAYVAGLTKRRQVWRSQILGREQQLPVPGSDDEKVLHEFAALLRISKMRSSHCSGKSRPLNIRLLKRDM